jgi:hypothetical protein
MKRLALLNFRCGWTSAGFLLACCSVALPAKDLVIERPALQQIEDGPPIDGSFEFLPGETAYLSFRIQGFETKEKDDEFRSLSLKYTIEVTDPTGIPAVEKFTGKVATDVRSEDKEWSPKIRREIRLPDFAVRGKYKIAILVQDETSSEESKAELTLTVRNRDVPPSDELVARGFGFYQTENDRRPMTKAVYHAGEPVIVRFDITGYKLGEKNAIDVEYGIQLVGPDEKAVISQPLAAAEKSESFYPRRWLPVTFRLDLPANPKKGQYNLTVQIRDKLAGKDLEVKQTLEVE